MKKVLLLVLALLCLFLPTGCVHYVELSELEIVENIVIDYRKEEYQITASIIEKKEEIEVNYVKGYGKTIEDAMESIKTKENKKIYIAHLNMLLLTPTAINQKLEEIVNYFLRNTESRNDFSVALVEDGIEIETGKDTKDMAQKIQIIEEDLGTTKTCSFEDLLKDLLEKRGGYLSYLKKVDDELKVEGIYLIEDYQVGTFLEKEEVILFNYLKNNIHQTIFKDYKVLFNHTNISFQDEEIKVTIESILREDKKDYEKVLTEEIQKMFLKYQMQGIDIFDFAHSIKIHNYPYFQKHQENLLSSIHLKIEVKKQGKEQGERRIEFDKTN